MTSFNDECLSRYIEARKEDPRNPAAGIGYIMASVIHRKMEEESKRRAKMYFVTINPKPDIKFDEFRRRTQKYFAKYKETEFAFEVRGKKDDLYYGHHCHILMKARTKKNDTHTIRSNIYKSFKDMVGNIKSIDVRLYPESYWEDKRDYISGKKWDDQKDEAILATKEWRESIGLKSIYVI